MPPQCHERDLASGRSALIFWCVPALALIVSGPLGDDRWWIWFPALVVMGAACLVNAARCGRLHCYFTGPVFLVAAVLSMLHGLHRTSLSWNWIGGGVLVGWLFGYVLEWWAGRYVQRAS